MAFGILRPMRSRNLPSNPADSPTSTPLALGAHQYSLLNQDASTMSRMMPPPPQPPAPPPPPTPPSESFIANSIERLPSYLDAPAIYSSFFNGLFSRPVPPAQRAHTFPSRNIELARKWLCNQDNWKFEGSPTSKDDFQSYLPLAWEITGINFSTGEFTKNTNKLIFNEIGEEYNSRQGCGYHMDRELVDKLARNITAWVVGDRFAMHFKEKVHWADFVGGWLKAYFAAFMGVFLEMFQKSQVHRRKTQVPPGVNRLVFVEEEPLDLTFNLDHEIAYMNYLVALGVGMPRPPTQPVDCSLPELSFNDLSLSTATRGTQTVEYSPPELQPSDPSLSIITRGESGDWVTIEQRI